MLPADDGRSTAAVRHVVRRLLRPRHGADHGALRVGTPITPDLAAALELPAAGPAGWTVITSSPEHRHVRAATTVRPRLDQLPGCRHTAIVVLRPDGVVAARGRWADIPSIHSWLGRVIGDPVTQPDMATDHFVRTA